MKTFFSTNCKVDDVRVSWNWVLHLSRVIKLSATWFYLITQLKLTYSRFTCFEKRFFSSDSFIFFCRLKQKKGLSANEKLIFLRRSAKEKTSGSFFSADPCRNKGFSRLEALFSA